MQHSKQFWTDAEACQYTKKHKRKLRWKEIAASVTNFGVQQHTFVSADPRDEGRARAKVAAGGIDIE